MLLEERDGLLHFFRSEVALVLLVGQPQDLLAVTALHELGHLLHRVRDLVERSDDRTGHETVVEGAKLYRVRLRENDFVAAEEARQDVVLLQGVAGHPAVRKRGRLVGLLRQHVRKDLGEIGGIVHRPLLRGERVVVEYRPDVALQRTAVVDVLADLFAGLSGSGVHSDFAHAAPAWTATTVPA